MNMIENGKNGLILYGLTPPKSTHTPEKIAEITQRRISRLNNINPDGLIIYDIQDEANRTNEERPFPYLSTVDPIEYKTEYLKDLDLPAIIYQCVGKYTPLEIQERMESIRDQCVVFVGTSSRTEVCKTSISQAYDLVRGSHNMLGGITIPERHVKKGDEHLRIMSKQEKGVQFFVSQFIFNIEKLKNMVSDYYYLCKEKEIKMVPIIFTVTPCGSQKTLDLLRWLGVDIPLWLRNDLIHSENPLELSMDLCMSAVNDISNYCLNKGIPFGCNIESASVRREEVLASFELVNRIEERFKELGLR